MYFFSGAPVSQRSSIGAISNVISDDVILLDTFETSIIGSWTKLDIQGAGAIAIDTTVAYHDAKSLKVTTAGAANDSSGAYRNFGYNRTNSRVLRFSTMVNIPAAAINDTAEIDLYLPDGTNSNLYAIKIIATAANVAKVQYQNSAGVWTNVATLLGVQNGYWFYLGMDIDVTNSKLLYIYFGDSKYSLNTASKTTASTAKHATLYLIALTGEASAKSAWWDDVLIKAI